MVEVLLIKINHTAIIEGINFAKTEGRSETFADDTTIYITFSEKNLKEESMLYQPIMWITKPVAPLLEEFSLEKINQEGSDLLNENF